MRRSGAAEDIGGSIASGAEGRTGARGLRAPSPLPSPAFGGRGQPVGLISRAGLETCVRGERAGRGEEADRPLPREARERVGVRVLGAPGGPYSTCSSAKPRRGSVPVASR